MLGYGCWCWVGRVRSLLKYAYSFRTAPGSRIGRRSLAEGLADRGQSASVPLAEK